MKFTPPDTTDRQLAKEIIVELIRASGGRFDGKKRLYKAFMFAHLYHFEDFNKILSHWPIVHMPQGHGIDDADSLIRELVETGRLRISYGKIGPYSEERYELISGGSWFLPEDAIDSIARAAGFVKDKTGTQLSDWVHEHSRSWNLGESGKELNIYIDALSDEEYSQEQGHVARVSSAIETAFQG